MSTRKIHRKESIISTAISIIHEKGFQGLSTREVARREGVSESTIFKHFKTKNELIFAVLDYLTHFERVLVEAAGNKQLSPKEAILFIFDGIFSCYQTYPEITAVFQFNLSQIHDDEIKMRVIELFQNQALTMKGLIERAIEAHELDSNVNSERLTDIILGTITRIILKWRGQNYSFSLKDYGMSAVNAILNSVVPKV